MKFRWKLLLLMLAVSIIPMVALRTFGIHNVQTMAGALSDEVHANRLAAAEKDLHSLLKGYGEALNLERERISMALFFVADFVRQAQASGETDDLRRQTPVGPFPPGAGGTPPGSRLCVVAPDLNSASHLRQAAQIAQIENTFATVSEQLGDLALRQYAGFASGVAAAYPCRRPGLSVADATGADWYRNAFRESVYTWSRPYRDEDSGRWATAISLLLEDNEERCIGVVSVAVDLDRLLERSMAFLDLPKRAGAALCMLEKQPVSGDIGLKILMEFPAPPTTPSEWLKVPDSTPGREVIHDIARHAARIVRMPVDGQDVYWAYAPLPYQGAALVVTVPAADLLLPSAPVQAAIKERLQSVELLTAGFLVLLAVVNAVVALVFSRTVTRPLESLSRAAGRLAAGDFDTRVAIGSKDEFGAMGTIFNQVGPQLKEHYRVREALQAAVEIQQSLLPQAPPRLPGLDLFAMSLYCEKIGGDYFDYLCVGEGGRQRLCVAVGDVSGHGISSAITMATARAFLRLRASLPGTLGEMVSDVNRKFVEDVEYSGQFMTLFLARIDRGARRVEWVRAGHDPGVLYDLRRDAFSELAGEGAPLGLSDHTRFAASAMGIEPGQVIVLGTDGVWETRSPEGEMFGKARLTELIRRHAEGSAQDIVLAVLDAVEEFRGPGEPEDDITLMAVKVTD